MKRGLAIAIISLILILPLVSAASDFPLNLLDNEWSKLGIVFIVLFASIYYFLNNRMNNAPVSGIIAAGISLLITIPIMKRELLDPLLDPGIVDWIILLALGIGVIFIFYRFVLAKKPGEIITLKRYAFRFFTFLILLIILVYILGEFLPETIKYGPIGDIIDQIRGLSFSIIIIAIVAFIALWFILRRLEERRYYREGRAKKSGEMRAERGRRFLGRNPQQIAQQIPSRRQIARLEDVKRKREAHRRKRENRLPRHQGNVNKRLFKKYGIFRGKKYE